MSLSAISPTTWNTLGLGVAYSWGVLSALATFAPHRTAELFGITTLSNEQTADPESVLGFSGLVGSRDLAIALAMYYLARKGRNDELGTLILSTMCICAADIGLVWRRRSYQENFFSEAHLLRNFDFRVRGTPAASSWSNAPYSHWFVNRTVGVHSHERPTMSNNLQDINNRTLGAAAGSFPVVTLPNGDKLPTGTVGALLINIKAYDAGDEQRRKELEPAIRASIPVLRKVGMFDLFSEDEWINGNSAGRALVGRLAKGE
ncbi:hypothetical protein QQS21_007808 [Conoideocrella luteorostrata]|uniref:DUF7709 domain-containing protein n=1 Tax=Conoideocrella luteorostrata TaxID=1105319 RepID=A0AAJ0FS14_9HYPO|nr:hypothetical protein QQS21_007808 [Conoideocrella luteorostrata]